MLIHVLLVSFGLRAIRALCRHGADLEMENLTPWQRVTALTKERLRQTLENPDCAFWVALREACQARRTD